MAKTGRPPKPVEQKRRTGNPGNRPLPDKAVVELLPAAIGIPDPPRPLSSAGRTLWDRAWQSGRAWIAETDAELLLLVCEQLDERQKNRVETQKQLERNNADMKFDVPVDEIVAKSHDSEVYDEQAKTCVECQACTRVCPTCHCFYLYDTKQKDYFGKMKMWDSCMRLAYARVAGGENPRKVLGDRLRHRFMHKFSYFLDRYGIDMCVGCGRCVDAEAGDVDIRVVLKKLYKELQGEGKEKAEAAK